MYSTYSPRYLVWQLDLFLQPNSTYLETLKIHQLLFIYWNLRKLCYSPNPLRKNLKVLFLIILIIRLFYLFIYLFVVSCEWFCTHFIVRWNSFHTELFLNNTSRILYILTFSFSLFVICHVFMLVRKEVSGKQVVRILYLLVASLVKLTKRKETCHLNKERHTLLLIKAINGL